MTVRVPFGPWLLGDLLGLGGFAEVRRARRQGAAASGVEGLSDLRSADIALKRLLPMLAGHAAAERAFSAERAALARVRAPRVVRLLESGTTRGLPWLALGWIDGGNLTQALRAGPLSVDSAAVVMADVAQALIACHAADVLHGDVAPGNVLIDREGRANLVDFGLATSPHAPPRPRGAGTPAFLDPDAAAGLERRPASDVCGLALLWIRMRAGVPPWGLGPPADQRRRAAAREVSPDVRAAAMAGLAPSMAAALNAALDGGQSTPTARDVGELFAAAAATASSRDELRARMLASLGLVARISDAAEDRGERITDPTGETVTLVGESTAPVELATDLD